MKYILFEDAGGHPVPILFPDRIDHEDMREQMPYGGVLAAGYAALVNGRFACHGDSPLGRPARKEDAAILDGFFNGEDA